MVILLLAALWRRFGEDPAVLNNLGAFKSVYVASEKAFEEVDTFVDNSCQEYGLQQIRLSEPMKAAFEHFLSENPTVKAIIVGIRRSDPYGQQLKPFDPTDSGWPDFMRVHPVLEWKYVNIWDFLRGTDSAYCCLYDKGYTSLGGTDSTVPNPKLLKKGTCAEFLPAYALVKDEEERLGRFRKWRPRIEERLTPSHERTTSGKWVSWKGINRCCCCYDLVLSWRYILMNNPRLVSRITASLWQATFFCMSNFFEVSQKKSRIAPWAENGLTDGRYSGLMIRHIYYSTYRRRCVCTEEHLWHYDTWIQWQWSL